MALLCTISAVAHGQTRVGADTAKALCFNSSPRPSCRSFFVVDLALMGQEKRGGTLFAGSFQTLNRGKLNSYVAGEVGWMRNRATNSALGGVIHIGANGGESARVATKLRYRRWLDHQFDVDLEGGPLLVGRDQQSAFANGAGAGVTTGVSVGYREYIALSAGYDIVRSSRTQSSLFIGARIGSWAAPVIAAAAVLVPLLIQLGPGN